MKLVKKYPLLNLFILGLLLRFSLLFLDYGWDIHNHIVWAKDLWQRGFAGFYEKQSSEVYATLSPNYPPLSLLLFYLSYPLQAFIYKIAWWLNLAFPLFPSNLIFFINERAFLAAMMKLPAVFADLGVAWFCYLIAKKILPKNKKLHLFIPSFILFNPAFFYNSALWGQIDVIPIFFVLFSFYLLLFSKRYLLSGLIFTLALLVKPTAFVYLALYIIFFINKYSLINFLKTFLIANFIFLISFFPYLKNLNNLLLPYSIYSEKILAAQSLPYVTNGAFNFWVLITGFAGIKDTAPFLFGISYGLWGYFITGSFIIFVLVKFFRHSGKRVERARPESNNDSGVPFDFAQGPQNDIFLAFFLIALVSFLFLTKMHERYSILPLPFLLLVGLKNQKLFKWFVILSLISFLNLYHSWPVPKLGFITEIIFLPITSYVLTLVNIILFLQSLFKFKWRN